MIKNKHINQVIQSLCEKLINDGDLSSPRNMQTLELMNEIVCIENPIEINTICTLKERKLSREYLKVHIVFISIGFSIQTISFISSNE